MSHSQDPHPTRSFFPFGNPFRMKSHKVSHMSPKLLEVLQGFEATLAERLRKLMPESKDEILSLSWMTMAMKSLCETHNDIRTLITDLDLPVSVWDEKWIDVYFDISTKLLDICNTFSSELSRLNQGNLPLKCALHTLSPASSSKSFLRACTLLDDWRRHINAKNTRIEKCSTILDSLVGSLDLPKVKNSAKGKVLMQAMYGVKVETVFVCSVFSAAFSGSSKKLLDLDVPETYLWAPSFKSLQTLVNEEIRFRFSSGKFSVLIELEAVEAVVKVLYPTIQGGVNTEDKVDKVEQELHLKTVEELGAAADKLSQGMDLLAKGVDGFFQAVLTSRDTLLSSLRFGKTVNDRVIGRNIEQQVVY